MKWPWVVSRKFAEQALKTAKDSIALVNRISAVNAQQKALIDDLLLQQSKNTVRLIVEAEPIFSESSLLDLPVSKYIN